MTDAAESLSLKVQVGSLLSEYASLVRQYFTAVNSLIETPNLPIENTPDYVTNRILAVDAKLQQAVQKSKRLYGGRGVGEWPTLTYHLLT
jgi:hypothetical protein